MELSFASLVPDNSKDSMTGFSLCIYHIYQQRYLLLDIFLVTKTKKEEQYMIFEVLELLVFYPLLNKCPLHRY